MIAPTSMNRRKFFAASSAAALSVGASSSPSIAQTDGSKINSENMVYEVTRTEAEWLEHFDTFTYFIMRKGLTEEPKTSPLWNETRAGSYHCKGCDLHSYDASMKADIDKGWVFFDHSQPNAVLTGIDGPVSQYGQQADSGIVLVELHCRRCGSHLGHLLVLGGNITHCINGTALDFKPTAA